MVGGLVRPIRSRGRARTKYVASSTTCAPARRDVGSRRSVVVLGLGGFPGLFDEALLRLGAALSA